jgi:hypothetical protein
MRLAPNTICTLFAVALAASAVVTGCACDTFASEIRASGKRGVAEVPQAKVHMKLAKEQMKLAEQLVANGQL